MDLNNFLKHVDINELHDKISNFRDLDFKNLSYADIQKEIMTVITFKTPKGDMCVLSPISSNYPSGTKFYRVRAIPEEKKILPLDSMKLISDCWEPPKEIVKAGRLNRDKEPLLYTSNDPCVAAEELKVKEGELFSLIVYESTDTINMTSIGLPFEHSGLDKNETLKHKMIQDFLKHEFIRDVGKGTEYLYKISEVIIKDYFDLPPVMQDAWCYPSIAKKGGLNVCFRPINISKLKLIGVQITSIETKDNNCFFKTKIVANNSGDGKTLNYYHIGSDEQKAMFPEMTSTA